MINQEQWKFINSDIFVGLWRFREFGKPKSFSATIVDKGYYWDMRPKPTIKETLDYAMNMHNQILEERGKPLKWVINRLAYRRK